MKLIVLLFLLGTVACNKKSSKIDTYSNTITLSGVEDRAAEMSSPSGWIACLNADGTPGCLGDSLLFTGLAMGSADCEHGKPYEDAIAGMVRNDRRLSRHPTLLGEISLDGLLGFYWGTAKRFSRCPEAAESLRDLFALSRSSSESQLEPYFKVVSTQVAAALGLGDPPSEHDRGLLGSEIAGWAFATVVQRAGAFRLHLGYLALDIVDAPKGKSAYCASVGKAGIPLLESFCGRAGLSDWLDAFQFDRMEYAFQRASWESEDPAGKRFPGVDFLVGYRQAGF